MGTSDNDTTHGRPWSVGRMVRGDERRLADGTLQQSRSERVARLVWAWTAPNDRPGYPLGAFLIRHVEDGLMFEKMIVNRAVAAIDLFAQCVVVELDRARFPAAYRQRLWVVFDAAMTHYTDLKGDSVTYEVIATVRPRVKAYLQQE